MYLWHIYFKPILRLSFTFLPILIFKSKKIKPTKSTYIVKWYSLSFTSNQLWSTLCSATYSSITSSSTKTHYGAVTENRTRATRSEAWDSATKLHPHHLILFNHIFLNFSIHLHILFRFFSVQFCTLEIAFFPCMHNWDCFSSMQSHKFSHLLI